MKPILDWDHLLKDAGGDVVGKVANDFEAVLPGNGPVEREDIGLDDVEALRGHALLQKVLLEILDQVAVEFDGDDFSGQGKQDLGQLPGSRSDFNDGILGADLSKVYDFLTVLGIGEKMLPEGLLAPRFGFHPGMVP